MLAPAPLSLAPPLLAPMSPGASSVTFPVVRYTPVGRTVRLAGARMYELHGPAGADALTSSSGSSSNSSSGVEVGLPNAIVSAVMCCTATRLKSSRLIYNYG